jgi:hypothetical protein
MERNWVDTIRKIMYVIVPTFFVSAMIYMFVFISSGRSPLIPYDSVQIIKEWTYYDQLTGPRTVTTPVKVEREDRDVFVYESKLPDRLPEGCVIAFLNRMDLKVEVGNRVVKEWKMSDGS